MRSPLDEARRASAATGAFRFVARGACGGTSQRVACRRPTWRCRWCCPNSTAGCPDRRRCRSRQSSRRDHAALQYGMCTLSTARIRTGSPLRPTAPPVGHRLGGKAGSRATDRHRAVGLSRASAASVGHAVGLDSFASLTRDPGHRCRDGGLCHRRETGTGCAGAGAVRRGSGAALHVARPIIGRGSTALPGPACGTACALPVGRRRPIRRRRKAGSRCPARAAGQASSLADPARPGRRHWTGTRSYHDPDAAAMPCLSSRCMRCGCRSEVGVHAIVHLGTHGSLEWLPGKADRVCPPPVAPAALLLGGLPVIYPFIVNNPGEAAAAKRRLGAVTIGHLTRAAAPPPVSMARLCVLERMIDDYAAADGLDRRRAAPSALRARDPGPRRRRRTAGREPASAPTRRDQRRGRARAPGRLSVRREGFADPRRAARLRHAAGPRIAAPCWTRRDARCRTPTRAGSRPTSVPAVRQSCGPCSPP